MKPAFRFVPIASSLHDTRAITALQGEFSPALERMGGACWEDPSDPWTPVIWFVLTGGTEQRLLDAMADHERRVGPGPVMLLAHGGQNSLPAALETLARLQQEGRKGRVLFVSSPSDAEGFERLAQGIHDLEAWRKMRQSRLGVIGRPSDWLVASTVDPQVVRAGWGPTWVPIEMQQFFAVFDEARRRPPTPSEPYPLGVSQGEVSHEAVRNAGRVALALETVIKTHRLDAITMRCFDLVMERKTTACHALSRLNDAGITAGCEGDVASVVGMMWVRALLGEPSWMANPAAIDEYSSHVVLAHCTVPRSMVGDCTLRVHFESGIGVALAGRFARGPVTLLRVGGRQLDKAWFEEGELVATSTEEGLCRTQAKVVLREGAATELLLRPLGNHLLLVRGHHGARLRSWWEQFGPG